MRGARGAGTEQVEGLMGQEAGRKAAGLLGRPEHEKKKAGQQWKSLCQEKDAKGRQGRKGKETKQTAAQLFKCIESEVDVD